MFVSLCRAARCHALSPRFDMAGDGSFQPHNPRHQKFRAPGKQMCEATRRGSDTPTHSTLLLSFPAFLSSFIFPSNSVFILPGFPAAPHLSRLTFLLFLSPRLPFHLCVTPLCHCSNFLPSWQACNCCPHSPPASFPCRRLTPSTSR